MGCCAILLDLAKAFDSVNRTILLFKLQMYGIRGVPLRLIKCYLSNRSQYIKCKNIKSDLHPSEIGVPQGSVLSPLLFLLFINDLKNSTELEIINFADDTLAYKRAGVSSLTQRDLNSEFNKINTWMGKNHLKLNIKKPSSWFSLLAHLSLAF